MDGLGLIPVGIFAMLVISLVHGVIARRRRFELRMQILEVLALCARRGLPFDTGLRKTALGERKKSRRILTRLARDLEQGEDLPEALRFAAPSSFPPPVLAALRATDGTAEVVPVLDSLVEQTDEHLAFLHRFAITLLYPICLFLGVVMAQEAVIGVYAFAPRFGQVPPTAEWFTIGGWFSGGSGLWPARGQPWVPLAVLILLTLWIAHETWRSGPVFRRLVQDLLPRVPWTSKAGRALAASRFLATLSHLVRAQHPLPSAMRRAVGAAGNRPLQRRVDAAALALEEGRSIGDSWQLVGLPASVCASVSAASCGRSDQLADTLRVAARTCRDRFAAARHRLLDVLQPLVVVFFGVWLAHDCVVLLSLNGYYREWTGLW